MSNRLTVFRKSVNETEQRDDIMQETYKQLVYTTQVNSTFRAR